MMGSDAGLGDGVQLSVVIPTMNKVGLLKQTLEALFEQDPGPGIAWEIVVVNDGSSDGTAAFLREAAADVPPAGPALRSVTPGQNVGRARARNLGVQAAGGRWVVFLDDDIVAPAGLLRAHLELLQAQPGSGTIGYAVTAPDLVDGPHFHYLDSRGVARLPAGAAPGRYFVTQNAAVPREAFLKVGGFDEGFSGYGFEDMELAFRLEEEAGVRFQALTHPVPHHVHHHTPGQFFAKKRECGRQSLPHIARLHPQRIPEMHLQHVMNTPGQGGGGLTGWLVRSLASGSFGRRLPRWLEHWPVAGGHAPVLRGVYFKLMNLAVLISFRQGLTDSAPVLPK